MSTVFVEVGDEDKVPSRIVVGMDVEFTEDAPQFLVSRGLEDLVVSRRENSYWVLVDIYGNDVRVRDKFIQRASIPIEAGVFTE